MDVAPDTNKQHNQYDLMDDIGIFPRTNDNEDLVVKCMTDDNFTKLVHSINVKQMEFFLNSIKTSDETLRIFQVVGLALEKLHVYSY